MNSDDPTLAIQKARRGLMTAVDILEEGCETGDFKVTQRVRVLCYLESNLARSLERLSEADRERLHAVLLRTALIEDDFTNRMQCRASKWARDLLLTGATGSTPRAMAAAALRGGTNRPPKGKFVGTRETDMPHEPPDANVRPERVGDGKDVEDFLKE